MSNLNDNIYIKTLKLGFENPFGITLKQVIENAKLSNRLDYTNNHNVEFKLTFLLWFYTNFHSRQINSITNIANIKNNINGTISKEINKTAIINGDAVNKYIDYVELSDARKSSRKATNIAYTSIAIASISIIVQFIPLKDSPPSNLIEITHKLNSGAEGEFQDSTCCEFAKEKMSDSKRKIINELKSKQQKSDTSNNPK